MNFKEDLISHIFRNKYLRERGGALNGSASGGGDTIINEGGTNINYVENAGHAEIADIALKLFKTLNIFGNQFDGTQDLDSITATTITTEYLEAITALIQSLTISGDLHVSGDTYTTNINNSDTITTKNLEVTGLAHFFELIIDKIRSASGAIMLTPCDGFKIDKVLQLTNGDYRLYFRSTDENGKGITNMWREQDQALCMSFNEATVGTSYNVSNKYYWTLVTSVSDEPIKTDIDGIERDCHYIDISTTIFDGQVNPEIGDDIVMCGYRGTDDAQRQSAIYISAYDSLDQGLKAPLFAEYKGINDFSLASHRHSYIDSTGASFKGEFRTENNTNIVDNFNNQIIDIKNEFSFGLNGLYSRVTKVINPNIIPGNGWTDNYSEPIYQENDEEYTLKSKETRAMEDNVQAVPQLIYLDGNEDYTFSIYGRAKYNNIEFGETKDLGLWMSVKTMVNTNDRWHGEPRSIVTFRTPLSGWYRFSIEPMDDEYNGDVPYEEPEEELPPYIPVPPVEEGEEIDSTIEIILEGEDDYYADEFDWLMSKNIVRYTSSNIRPVVPWAKNPFNTEIVKHNFFDSSNGLFACEDRITSINGYAFFGCRNLCKIKIPSSVTQIAYSAFERCSDLEITCYATTPPDIYPDTFRSTYVNALYVPSWAIEAYTNSDWINVCTNILPISI